MTIIEEQAAEIERLEKEREGLRADLAAARALLREARGWLLLTDYPIDYLCFHIDAALGAQNEKTKDH